MFLVFNQLKINIAQLNKVISNPSHPLLQNVRLAKESYHSEFRKLIMDIIFKDI